MAENQTGAAAAAALLEVECVVSLRHDEDYLTGRCYRVSQELFRQYPENFRPAGWREAAAREQRQAAERVAAKVAATQDEYERARDHQEYLEAVTEVQLAQARKERAEQLRRAAEEEEQEALAAKDELPAAAPPPRAPPPQDLANPLEAAARTAPVKTAGPNATLPRAERLKRSAGAT